MMMMMMMMMMVVMILVAKSHGLGITLEEMECVHQKVEYDGDLVTGTFLVEDHQIFWPSRDPGIDFMVTAPAGNVVYTLKESLGETFEFMAPRRGQYKFCFRNRVSSPKTLTFDIHVGHIPNEHDYAKDEHLNPVEVKIGQLREVLESITMEQNYLKARDARHRRTVESTQRRLIGYTLVEYLALLVASALQVFFIRRMFNSKRMGYNKL